GSSGTRQPADSKGGCRFSCDSIGIAGAISGPSPSTWADAGHQTCVGRLGKAGSTDLWSDPEQSYLKCVLPWNWRDPGRPAEAGAVRCAVCHKSDPNTPEQCDTGSWDRNRVEDGRNTGRCPRRFGPANA